MIFQILNKNLTDDTSVKWSIIKTFLVFILMKLGEVVVHMSTTISRTKFQQSWIKQKKVFIYAHLTEVSSVKVLLSTR